MEKGVWGWGFGEWGWGMGIGDWAQSPIPNPQSPIFNVLLFIFLFKNKLIQIIIYNNINKFN